MLSRQLKRDIRQLWDHFWSGGIANPLTAIEQITYLVFLKRLEDLSQEPGRASEWNIPKECRWSYIKQLPAEECLKHVRGTVFDWLRELDIDDEGRMQDAVFVIPNATLLRRAIDIIDRLFIASRNQDTLGDIYEHLLKEIAEAGKNGQFRTPRHIIRAMCDLVDPQYGERICDPACGTSGFLVNAYQHILKTNTSKDILQFEADGTPIRAVGDRLSSEQHAKLRQNSFYGYDFDRTMVRLGWMNMIQHGLEKPKANYANTLGSAFNKKLRSEDSDDITNFPFFPRKVLGKKPQSNEVGNFDVILANPPFTGSIDKSDIGESLRDLKTTKTELLFVGLILQLLRVGGRAAVIVPEGVLFGSTTAHKTLREKLVAENRLNAVISLPGGVFQPYTGVKTSILVFETGGKTDEVWFYEVAKDGESLDAKRNPRPQENDLWDMTLKYRLQFSDSAPAFVDGDTWKQWQEQEPKRKSFLYAKPIIATEEIEADETENNEPEVISIPIFQGVEPEELIEPKTWSASTEELPENGGNLSAGRYKPLTLTNEKFDPPAQIIGELKTLEQTIQTKLDLLLSLIKGRK